MRWPLRWWPPIYIPKNKNKKLVVWEEEVPPLYDGRSYRPAITPWRRYSPAISPYISLNESDDGAANTCSVTSSIGVWRHELVSVHLMTSSCLLVMMDAPHSAGEDVCDVIGHGSGSQSSDVRSKTNHLLREQHNSIEETRDLSLFWKHIHSHERQGTSPGTNNVSFGLFIFFVPQDSLALFPKCWIVI